jgi:hypothetical protein
VGRRRIPATSRLSVSERQNRVLKDSQQLTCPHPEPSRETHGSRNAPSFSSSHFSPSQHTTPPKGGLHFRRDASPLLPFFRVPSSIRSPKAALVSLPSQSLGSYHDARTAQESRASGITRFARPKAGANHVQPKNSVKELHLINAAFG